jgi:branched-chain amino acid transport system substrate-binding protein
MNSKFARVVALGCAGALLLTLPANGATKKPKPKPGKATTTAAPAPTAAPTTKAADPATTAAPAAPAVLAKDAVDGIGAKYLNEKMLAAGAKPLKASGDPVVIGLRNTEGNPGGSFPDAREGAEAAVKYINDKLGGIGGDPATGKAGRPIKLEVCIDKLVPAEAAGCANQIASKNPVATYFAIDFFAAIEYQTLGNSALIQSLPISSADWNNPNVIAVGGGCVSAFPGIITGMAKAGAKKVAVAYSDNEPGRQCWKFTQEPVFKELGIEAVGFPFTPGAPDLSSTAQKMIDIGPDFAHWGVADIDCAKLWSSMRQLGYKGQIWVTGSCNNPKLLKDTAASADGVVMGFLGYDAAFKDADVPAFNQYENKVREEAIKDYAPKSGAVTSFMRFNFSQMMFLYESMDELVRANKTINADNVRAQLDKAVDHHKFGSKPADCGAKIQGFIAACEWFGAAFRYNAKDASWTKVNDFLDTRPILRKVGPKLPPS